jgi:hypothetical protein
VRLEDGRFAWYQDSFGSCSGCDAWEDAPDKDVRSLCISLANSARVFLTLDEMKADLRDQAENDAKGSWFTSAAKAFLKELGL